MTLFPNERKGRAKKQKGEEGEHSEQVIERGKCHLPLTKKVSERDSG